MLLRHASYLLMALLFLSCKKDSAKEESLIIHLRQLPQTDLILQADGLGKISEDSFGAVYQAKAGNNLSELSLVEAGTEKTWASYKLPRAQGEYWIYPSSEQVFEKPLPALPRSSNEILVYFDSTRPDINDWGLHVWDSS